MNSSSKLSFIIAFILYGLLLVVGYWLWVSQPIKPQNKPALTQVPVSLAMFAEPVVQEQPPIEQPTPKIEPIVKEPIVEEKIIEKPVVKEIKPEPKPLPKKIPKPKPIKKEIKKVIKKTIEKPPIKKPVKPVEQVKPTPKPVISAKEPIKEVPKTQAKVPPKVLPKKQSAPAYNAQQTANAEQIYLSELRKQIIQYAHDTYPRRAKRRHWEGDVTIEFNLMPNGRIVGLKIVESSGRSILDQAALEIFQVKMANMFKPFPKEVNRKVWQIKVPVTYNLR